jgi:hypothetical protein
VIDFLGETTWYLTSPFVNASTVHKIFVRHLKKIFATISALNRRR